MKNLDPTQPNLWVNLTRGQLCVGYTGECYITAKPIEIIAFGTDLREPKGPRIRRAESGSTT